MSDRPWLTRNLKITSAVSVLQDAASELLYPLMPILLTSVLGAPAAVVGAVEGVAEGVAALTKYVSGRLADRHRKVPLVGLGDGLAALGKLFVAAAGVWPVVLVGRCVDRLGKGIRGTPRDALLVDGIPVAARGRAFGFHRAADTAGAVVGPLLALAALQVLDGDIRLVLWVALVPAVMSALLVFTLREPPRPAVPNPAKLVGWDAAPAGKASLDWGTSWVGGKSSLVAKVPSVIVPEESTRGCGSHHAEGPTTTPHAMATASSCPHQRNNHAE